jgi:tetratricopeptide (TPR) repeat protein
VTRSQNLWLVLALMAGAVACTEGSSKPSRPPVPTLTAPAGLADTEAGGKNNVGASHLEMRHYAIAEGYVRDAIALRPDFAEAYFNLGVALDGMGKHPEATEAFRQATTWGANNPAITGSEIVKQHLGS